MIRALNARSVSEGPGRDSFYRFQELYKKGGDLALAEMTPAKPNLISETTQDACAIGAASMPLKRYFCSG
ncbi:MAG: hypothetical protein ACOYJ6_15670 [Caulobacterales bacterium]|jgi:hypothetical protein